MDRKTEIKLIKQALELKARGETQYHESTQTLSTERYISPAWFARENETMFQKQLDKALLLRATGTLIC